MKNMERREPALRAPPTRGGGGGSEKAPPPLHPPNKFSGRLGGPRSSAPPLRTHWHPFPRGVGRGGNAEIRTDPDLLDPPLPQPGQGCVRKEEEGGGGLGPKGLCTKNGLIRFSRIVNFVVSHDGHFGHRSTMVIAPPESLWHRNSASCLTRYLCAFVTLGLRSFVHFAIGSPTKHLENCKAFF